MGEENEYEGREKTISEIETDARKAMKPNVWMYGVRIAIVVLICLGIGWGLVSVYL